MLRGNTLSVIYAVAASLVVACPLLAQRRPLIPVNTNFLHWDHHWFMWTPRHPSYESIEVMSHDTPRDPNQRIVWAFFTERAGGKKQVHYLSDPALAKNWRGEAYLRDIEYETEGDDGAPKSLRVKFEDKDGRRVEWTVKFKRGQALGTDGAGLTDQSGHSSGSIFLLFYREKNARTADSRLVIGEEDFSFAASPEVLRRFRFHTAYSFNVYSAAIVYGRSRFEYEGDAISNSFGRVFRTLPKERRTYTSSSPGDENTLELKTNSRGELRSYGHARGGHVFQIDFNPALPNLASADSGQRISYQMSLDNFRNVVEGVLSVKKEGRLILFEWRHQKPAWTRRYRFLSTVEHDGEGDYELLIKRLGR